MFRGERKEERERGNYGSYGRKFNRIAYKVGIVAPPPVGPLVRAAHEFRSSMERGSTGVGNVASRSMYRPGSPNRYGPVAAPSLGKFQGNNVAAKNAHGDRTSEYLIQNEVGEKHPSYNLHKFDMSKIPLFVKNENQYKELQRKVSENREKLRKLGYNTYFYSELKPCTDDKSNPNNYGCRRILMDTLMPQDIAYYSIPYEKMGNPENLIEREYRDAKRAKEDEDFNYMFGLQRELGYQTTPPPFEPPYNVPPALPPPLVLPPPMLFGNKDEGDSPIIFKQSPTLSQNNFGAQLPLTMLMGPGTLSTTSGPESGYLEDEGDTSDSIPFPLNQPDPPTPPTSMMSEPRINRPQTQTKQPTSPQQNSQIFEWDNRIPRKRRYEEDQ